MVERASEVTELVVEKLDFMKMVKHYGCARQKLAERNDISCGYADSHSLDNGAGAL